MKKLFTTLGLLVLLLPAQGQTIQRQFGTTNNAQTLTNIILSLTTNPTNGVTAAQATNIVSDNAILKLNGFGTNTTLYKGAALANLTINEPSGDIAVLRIGGFTMSADGQSLIFSELAGPSTIFTYNVADDIFYVDETIRISEELIVTTGQDPAAITQSGGGTNYFDAWTRFSSNVSALTITTPTLTNSGVTAAIPWGDANGRQGELTIGSGLSLAGSTLSATGSGGSLEYANAQPVFTVNGNDSATLNTSAGDPFAVWSTQQDAFNLDIAGSALVINAAGFEFQAPAGAGAGFEVSTLGVRATSDLITPNSTLGVNSSGYIVSVAGGSGISTTNGNGTNTTFYTADNDPVQSGGSAITLRPLESRTTPGGAAAMITMYPPYNPPGYNGVFRTTLQAVTNTLGDLRPDVIWNQNYNAGINSSGVGTYGTGDTNEPAWQSQRESRWQNLASLSQLEWWESWSTPFTQWGTNMSWRWFGANLNWNTADNTYASSDGNIGLGTFHIYNPKPEAGGLYGVQWAAANPLKSSYDQTIKGTVRTLTNDVGNGGIRVLGGSIDFGAPSGFASPYVQLVSDWNNQIGGRGAAMYLNANHASSFFYGIPNGTWSNNVFATNINSRGFIGAALYITPTNGILWQGGAQLTNIYTATATLDFGNAATIGCADLTMTVTGAAIGDVVDLGVPNASVVANSSFSAWVSAADTVTVRFCALISGDPPSGLFRAEVHKWK